MGGGTEAFPELGSHCNYEDCHQLDFLPFTCDCCSMVFCLDHRSYSGHSCPNAGVKDVAVLVCPVCAAAVKSVFGESPDLTIEKHMAQQGSCDPSNYDRVMKRPKCPVKRCREVLTTSNTYLCKACKVKVCLKHRFPADHACARPAPPKAGAPVANANAIAEGFIRLFSNRKGTECASSSNKSGPKRIGSDSSKSLSVH